jgi:NitT/TauT family transport system ATP-binding protein
MARVTAKGLWKKYGDTVVLENVNLEVADREFVTIVGASGCGKTTFLKMLLGMETPTKGHLLIDGEPIVPEPNADRGIVFQRYSLFPHLTVLENVLLGLEFERSKLLGKLFGTAPSRDKYPAQLSGGMQQRLSIAQSVIRKPKILLLDEPFGALDPGITLDLHKLILEVWAANEMTIFMITHDIKESFQLGTRLLVFDKVRHDPQAPEAYGARVTYDLRLKGRANHPTATALASEALPA